MKVCPKWWPSSRVSSNAITRWRARPTSRPPKSPLGSALYVACAYVLLCVYVFCLWSDLSGGGIAQGDFALWKQDLDRGPGKRERKTLVEKPIVAEVSSRRVGARHAHVLAATGLQLKVLACGHGVSCSRFTIRHAGYHVYMCCMHVCMCIYIYIYIHMYI